MINVPVLPVGLYEWKITPAHPTIMFNPILWNATAFIWVFFCYDSYELHYVQ